MKFIRTLTVIDDNNKICKKEVTSTLQFIIMKRCKNCGRLFVADRKRKYCNQLQPNGQTCYQIGLTYAFKERKHNEPALCEYMRAYRRVQNFCDKNKNLISESDKTSIFSSLRQLYDDTINHKYSEDEGIQLMGAYCYSNLEKCLNKLHYA